MMLGIYLAFQHRVWMFVFRLGDNVAPIPVDVWADLNTLYNLVVIHGNICIFEYVDKIR